MSSTPVAHDFWLQALDHTKSRSPATFVQWFSSVQFDGIEELTVHLAARDEFVRDWVREHFLPSVLQFMGNKCGGPLQVKWRVAPELDNPICAAPTAHQLTGRAPIATHSPKRTTPSSQAPTGPEQGALFASLSSPAGNTDSTGSTTRNWSVTQTSQPASLSETKPSVSHHAASSAQSPTTASHRADQMWGATSSTPRVSGPQDSNSTGRGKGPPSIAPGLGVLGHANARGLLNPKHTFDNFIVGPSNELAFAAATSSAGSGPPRYNPLFIAGGTGLGKTHLMHAIAHQVLELRPEARIVYVSAEHFTNEFIEALQNRRMEEFRARYRTQCDVLLLDDIQFLAGREQTQEEFFHTFNALHNAGVPIIVTSDKYPQQLQRMPERLVSRFTSGLVADVQTPKLETRVAIVKKKAQLEGIDLPDHVAEMLAQHVQSNVRELEGALIRLAAKASLCGQSIDDTLLRGDLSLVASAATRVVCVSDIQRAVCSHFRVTNTDLLSKDRHKSVAFARQVAMYICRQRLKSSFPELGRAFGNRDHTTVMSAVRRVENLRKRDPQVDAHLDAIECKLASSND